MKAAKILRDPEAFLSVPHLTAEEKQALSHERGNGFWVQPKELKVTIITLCVAAVVQGWNQTASNGANLDWPMQFGLQQPGTCQPTGSNAWIFAIVNASTYLAASLVGCWLSDPANEYFFGRRGAICISALLILAAIIGSATAQGWRELLGFRVLLGIGMGCKASVVPVFAAEIAPPHIRGSLVMNWQLFDALGIMLGFSANLAVSQVGPDVWRWQTASSVLPTIVLLSLIFTSTESPRFLMKHNRYRAAYQTLLALRGEPVLAAKEMLYVHYQMDVEMRFLNQRAGSRDDFEQDEMTEKQKSRWRRLPRLDRSINYWQKLGQLFTVKRIRRAMLAAIICMISQQLCGVNVLAFYSTTFLACGTNNNNTDSTHLKPLFFSWGIGLTNFLFAFPAYYLIDRRGRRWLLLVTLPILAITMLAAALSFLIPRDSSAHELVIVFWIYAFMVFYSWGLGPVPFTMSAEVFPLENRVVGMSFAVFTNFFGAGILTLVVPALINAIGHSGILGIFAGLNVIAFVLVFFFVRETAGATLGGTPGSMTFMSLEELNYIFGVSTMRHAAYQFQKALPWTWKHYTDYFRREKTCPDQPEKLYTWASAHRHEVEDEDDQDEEVMAQIAS